MTRKRLFSLLVAGALPLAGGSASFESAGALTAEFDTAATALEPWFLSSASEFRLGSPPGPARTKREVKELLSLQKRRGDHKVRRVRALNRNAATVPWTKMALRMIVEHRPAAFPTRTARSLTLLHLGMYDALTAAEDSRAAYHRPRPHKVDSRLRPLVREGGSSYPDRRAAVAGAAERILAYLFPQEPPSTFSEVADKIGESRLWAGVAYRSDVARGRRLGQRVADLVIARATTDGSGAPWDFEGERRCSTTDCGAVPGCGSSDGAEENWMPTPPACQYPPTDPMTSRWETYVLDRPDQFRPDPPPEYGSVAFMAELAEVKERSDSSSEDERELAFFWDDGPGTYSPAGHWNEIALAIVADRGLNTRATARVFAYMNAAIRDAFVAAWDAKFHYWSIRPVTVIRERPIINGVPNPLYDPGWLSTLVTPPFPAYPSGHTAESAAAARMLQYLVPDSGAPDARIKDEMGPAGSIDALAEEVAVSRLIGGIHFRSDNEVALILGRRVARLAIERAETEGG